MTPRGPKLTFRVKKWTPRGPESSYSGQKSTPTCPKSTRTVQNLKLLARWDTSSLSECHVACLIPFSRNVNINSIFGSSENVRYFFTKIPPEKIRHFKINPTTHHYPKLDFLKSSSFRLRRFQPIIEILIKISERMDIFIS